MYAQKMYTEQRVMQNAGVSADLREGPQTQARAHVRVPQDTAGSANPDRAND